jgi:hypothetical protein
VPGDSRHVPALQHPQLDGLADGGSNLVHQAGKGVALPAQGQRRGILGQANTASRRSRCPIDALVYGAPVNWPIMKLTRCAAKRLTLDISQLPRSVGQHFRTLRHLPGTSLAGREPAPPPPGPAPAHRATSPLARSIFLTGQRRSGVAFECRYPSRPVNAPHCHLPTSSARSCSATNRPQRPRPTATGTPRRSPLNPSTATPTPVRDLDRTPSRPRTPMMPHTVASSTQMIQSKRHGYP